jgi:hypothetical protein
MTKQTSLSGGGMEKVLLKLVKWIADKYGYSFKNKKQ